MPAHRIARAQPKAPTTRANDPGHGSRAPAAHRPGRAGQARAQQVWDFDVPLFSPDRVAARHPAALQAKLAVGSTNDPLEHEADRVAEKVMRMPDPAPVSQAAPLQLSRKCEACEEEDKAAEEVRGRDAAADSAADRA